MSAADESVLIASFTADASARARARLREVLGLPAEPGAGERWHSARFVTLRLAEVAPDPVARLRDGVPELAQAVYLPSGQRLCARQPGQARAPVELAPGVRVGDGRLNVIAGPCSVESLEQVLLAADIVAEAGARALRGGVFKPRQSPYAFGGLGERGLEHLCRARERTGLPVVTEALDCAQVELLARYADVIQIGSRNMSNCPLLFAAGANSGGKPVLLKRGLSASIAEFLDAAEHVLLGRLSVQRTAPGLILCERGIRTFAPSLRFTLDVGAIPLLQERAPLPVIADPSHPAGERALVPALGRAAAAAGADGLIVEVHPDPDQAWSDGAQSLDAAGFRALMRDLRRYAACEEGWA